jgi:small conductance mechanosensitive channel
LGIRGVNCANYYGCFPYFAQLPAFPNLQLPPLNQPSDDSDTTVATTWIRLDGRRLFQIAAPRANLSDRVDDIQQRLQSISQDYFKAT